MEDADGTDKSVQVRGKGKEKIQLKLMMMIFLLQNSLGTADDHQGPLWGDRHAKRHSRGSDSVETASSREVAFFFPDFSIAQWAEEEEPLSGRGKVDFDRQRWQHTPLGD